MLNISYEEFRRDLIAIEPYQINRNTDSCNWVFDPANGLFDTANKLTHVFHERSYWGKCGLSTVEYWSEAIFTNKDKAEEQADKYGGHVMESFYCAEDNKTYFICFNNFDNAAKFSYDFLNRD